MNFIPDEELNPSAGADAMEPPLPFEDREEPDDFSRFGTDDGFDSTAGRLDDWKAALRRDFDEWLESIDDIPDDDTDTFVEDVPDLYAFYEQLAAANAESRKSNRRTAEAFSQWGETLTKFDGDLRLLREHLARQPAAKDDALPRSWCLALIEIVDRLRRLAAALSAPPPKKWWAADVHWRMAWDNQRQGVDIMLSHVEALLARAGITRLITLHQPFDPAAMSAVAAEPSAQWPPQTVLEEVAPGYLLHGELLRVAQVKVSANKDRSHE